MATTKDIEQLSQSLRKEIVDKKDEPDLERSRDLIQALATQKTMSTSILRTTGIGKTLTKCVKTLQRHRRTSTHKETLDELIQSGESLLGKWKAAVDAEDKKARKEKQEKEDKAEGLPETVSSYHSRLNKQKKELYKNPPVLPPGHISIETERVDLPKRDKKMGQLTFVCGNDKSIQKVLQDFHPNRTPEEVLRSGSFGGTYFRSISSAVTNVAYKCSDVLRDSVDPAWIEGLDKKRMLTSSTYQPAVNKFGVKCGGSLGMWESSGWISDSDPYGWFQWYCRFYQGRRCSDDLRQIQRWAKSAGPKGRFRSQLCNKILAAHTTCDDASISPVIRQTMLHWGLAITEDVLERHRKRVQG
jgi:hypothetical protein